ncbi:MAG TPA: HD domain-containing protein [Bryobacteraceae bacterium]|nr:HD domain-containing protein [Bryobacteraceae bacterium]
MSTLARAIAIAAQAHVDQREKSGAPYIMHPIRMMLRMDTDAEKMVAILHDVVEDTPWTLDQLRTEGFSEEVVEAVDCVTRRHTETYAEFVERARYNPVARKVKIADLEDNMDIRRLPNVSDKSLERLKKYHEAWRSLRDVQ